MYLLNILFFVNIVREIYWVSCTIDMNLSELEYLAAHMNIFECRRLVAALHYTSYELPRSMEGAVRKIDESISCLGHLLHWNSSPSEGRGKTHQHLEHRLRQINRNDLANWLGRTVFKQLGEDLHNAVEKPFGKLGEQITEIQYPVTVVPIEELQEENPWQAIDTLLMILLIILLMCLLLLFLATAVHKIKIYKFTRKNDESQNIGGKTSEKMYSEEEEDYLLDSDVENKFYELPRNKSQ